MEERGAQAVALARAFEEADPTGLLLRSEDRHAATEAARSAGDVSAQAAKRAELLIARLDEEVGGLARARSLTRFGTSLAVPVAALAAAAGLASDALGTEREVNLLSFPLLALLAWNLAVYVALAAAALVLLGRRGGGAGADESSDDLSSRRGSGAAVGGRRGFVGGVLGWLAEWSLQRVRLRDSRAADVVRRAVAAYWREWGPAFAPLGAARIRLALHVGAACLAAGTVAGMYLRGLTFAYGVTWESTFLGPEAVAAILRVALAPAAALTGQPLPTATELAALHVPGTARSAAAWIHLWAVTAGLVVVVPRLALAAFQLVRQSRLARDLPIDPLRGSFRALLAPDRGSGTLVVVLPYSMRLDARAVDALGELVHEVFGLQAEVRVCHPLDYGAAADGLGDAPATCFVVVYPAVQSPEREVHGRFLEELLAGRDLGLLVIVDGSVWAGERGAAADERRRAERRRAWDRVLRASGTAGLHLDLGAPLPDDAAERAEECLRTTVGSARSCPVAHR